MSETKPRPIFAVFFVAVSVLLFLASLTQDGFHLEGGDFTAWSSMSLLLTGWLGLLVGVPAWLANPALAATWILSLLGRSCRWYARRERRRLNGGRHEPGAPAMGPHDRMRNVKILRSQTRAHARQFSTRARSCGPIAGAPGS